MSQLWGTSGATGTGAYRSFFAPGSSPSPPSNNLNLFYTGLAPAAPSGSNLPASRVIAYGSRNGGLNAGPKASSSLRAFVARIGPLPALVVTLQLNAASGLWPYGNESAGNLP